MTVPSSASIRTSLADPTWEGRAPEGIDGVFRSESEFNYVLGRILAGGPQDHDAVVALLHQYRVQPLSEYLGTEAPPPAPEVTFPPYDAQKANSAEFIAYFNFLLDFVKIHPDDREDFQKFAKIGIGKGKRFDSSALDPAMRQALEEGAKAGHQAIMDKKKTTGRMVNGWSMVGEAFGPRSVLQGKWLLRAAGAAIGLYGNDIEEAANFSCALDGDGNPLNAANGQKYIIRFEKGQTPPVDAFWSITMYRLPEVLFVDNPIDRYSISDRTRGIRYGKDGSLTIYLQHQRPPKGQESNWLPAPDGPFLLALRNYIPKRAILDGSWSPPPATRVK